MSGLSLCLLGPFEALLDCDQQLRFPSAKTQALLALLWYGGIEAIHHAVLRTLLRREGSIPSRYSAFLDQAVDLIFLRRVGGGYIFIHQLLQDYFARKHNLRVANQQ